MRTLALLLLLTAPAAADPPLGRPVPATFPTPDGRHVFVLVPPPSADPKQADSPHHAKIRATYPKGSGLYAAGDPSTPLWAVDWYAYDVFPADDAVSLVRVHGENMLARHFVGGRLPDEDVADQLRAEGLTFYRGGKPVRTYTVREMVKDPDALPHAVKHILWMAGGTVTKDGRKFVLMTHDSRQVVFDLESGAVVSERAAGLGDEAKLWVIRGSMAVVGLAGVAAVGLYVYFSRKKDPFSRPTESGARAPHARPTPSDG